MIIHLLQCSQDTKKDELSVKVVELFTFTLVSIETLSHFSFKFHHFDFERLNWQFYLVTPFGKFSLLLSGGPFSLLLYCPSHPPLFTPLMQQFNTCLVLAYFIRNIYPPFASTFYPSFGPFEMFSFRFVR